MSDIATCRGCGRGLNGEPYYKGKPAYHPDTGERCPVNFYGGFACSEGCDRHVLYEMESSFPGAGKATSLSSGATQQLRANWEAAQ